MDEAITKERVGRLTDAYFDAAHPIRRKGVASRRATDFGVPAEMWAGPVEPSGWVDWKLLPSSLTDLDVARLEAIYGVAFPPSFEAYLLARFHCFRQFKSAKYQRTLSLPDLPSRDPFRSLRALLEGWRMLSRLELIPFAVWGDGWGPMCFDTRRRDAFGECPIVWLDHEKLLPFHERGATRDELAPLEQPLYPSFGELLLDVFGQL